MTEAASSPYTHPFSANRTAYPPLMGLSIEVPNTCTRRPRALRLTHLCIAITNRSRPLEPSDRWLTDTSTNRESREGRETDRQPVRQARR